MEKPPPIPQKIVMLDTASKLAQRWMMSMSGGAEEEEPCEEKIEGRPSRLGLGAKFVPHSKVAASCNPVERKLQRKLESEKKRTNEELEESNTVDESEDDDLDSRANAFAKRRSSFSMSDMESKLPKSGKRKRK